MKLKECKECYYEGRIECFYYNKEYKELNIKECKDGFLHPYEHKIAVGELCKNCYYYETEQCLGNEIAKENCMMGY